MERSTNTAATMNKKLIWYFAQNFTSNPGFEDLKSVALQDNGSALNLQWRKHHFRIFLIRFTLIHLRSTESCYMNEVYKTTNILLLQENHLLYKTMDQPCVFVFAERLFFLISIFSRSSLNQEQWMERSTYITATINKKLICYFLRISPRITEQLLYKTMDQSCILICRFYQIYKTWNIQHVLHLQWRKNVCTEICSVLHLYRFIYRYPLLFSVHLALLCL